MKVSRQVRIATSAGPFLVRTDARVAAVRLHIQTPVPGSWYALTLDLARPSLRTHEFQGGSRMPFDGRWSRHWTMRAPWAGCGWGPDAFVRASEFVDYACVDLAETEPAATLARVRYETNGVIREAIRAALARCEPDALNGARRLHPAARFFVYGRLLRDPSRRIRQLLDTCPGLLLFCAGAWEYRGGAAIVDRALGQVVAGKPLRHVIRAVVEESVASRAEWDDRLAAALDAAGRETFMRHARFLVRKAGPATYPKAIIAAAPLAFAPEDIPRRHDFNAEWYDVMSGVAQGLAEVPRDAAIATSTFASRHFRALASAGNRAAGGAQGSWFTSAGSGEIARKLGVYAAETGGRPRRCSAPCSYIDRARGWLLRERDGGSPVYRVGRLLDRLRDLDLGTVVGVSFLSDDVDWTEVGGQLPFPEWPWASVIVPGIAVTHIRDATRLAEEAREMEHCAATLLAEALEGEYALFSVRTETSRLTVALDLRHDGTYAMSELRGVGNRAPSYRECRLVQGWVDAVNSAVRRRSAGSAA